MITSSVRKAGPYAGNGSTTVFPFAFKVFNASEVLVVFTDALGNEAPAVSGYTVSLNANQDTAPGGTVTYAAAPATNTKVTLTSAVAATQPMQITNGGGFFPRVLNDSADRQTILIQQLAERQARSLSFPISETGLTLPTAAQRAGNILGFSNTGGGFQLFPPATFTGPVGPIGPVGPATFPNLQSTGGADRLATLNALAASTSAFALSSGSFTLSAPPNTTNKTIMGFGATLAGPGYPTAADISAINTSGAWFTRADDRAGNGATVSSQLVALPSGNHAVNYQKDAGQDSLLCYDNSTYSRDGNGTLAGISTSARDMVARTATFTCPGQLNLLRLRAWCFNAFGRVGTSPADNGTVDGNATTFEGRLDNYGTSQPYFQTSTTKNLMQLYAGGNRTVTAAASVGLADGNYVDQGFYFGFVVEAAAIKRYAFAVVDINGVDQQNALWGVTPTGAMEMKGMAAPAAPTAGRTRTFTDINGNLAVLFDTGRKQIIAPKKPRVAHVLDMNGWDSTGVNDNAALYQTLINQAAADGVDVVAGTGKFLLGSTIVLPDGHSFQGKYGAGFNTDPLKASTFYIAHTGKGFTRAGAGSAAISITNQATLRDQPAVGGGAWVPNDHDFDYYFEDISDLRMTGIRTTNATRGIYMNGGRNCITDWLGQHFKIGLKIDWSYDTVSLDNLHLWPMWKQDAAIKAYSQDNLTSLSLGRVDNPFFTRLFSIWHRIGIDIGYYPGDGPNKPAGTVSKLKLVGADIDIGDVGYRVRPEADGHTASWSAVSMQARDEVISSALVLVEGPNTDITGDVKLSNSGGNGIRMAATATGSEVALLSRINNYNRTNGGFPAVEVLGGHFDRLPGSRTKNGNGGGEYAGNVTVWNP